MKISILTTDPYHPVVASLINWQSEMCLKGHEVSIHYDKGTLSSGEILFLVSCSQMIRKREKDLFSNVLVLHASDLPNGRGWSPHIWSIVNGCNNITLCLLEASEPVDSGKIWLKTTIPLIGDELLNEINQKLFLAELNLMTRCIQDYDLISPCAQDEVEGFYLRKRNFLDSEIDVNNNIISQFNLLRTVDNVKYPAFFWHLGNKYIIKIEKEINEQSTD